MGQDLIGTVPSSTANLDKLTQVVTDACYAHPSFVISRVTGAKLSKFLHYVGESPQLTHPSVLQYSRPFQNASATNKGAVSKFC